MVKPLTCGFAFDSADLLRTRPLHDKRAEHPSEKVASLHKRHSKGCQVLNVERSAEANALNEEQLKPSCSPME